MSSRRWLLQTLCWLIDYSGFLFVFAFANGLFLGKFGLFSGASDVPHRAELNGVLHIGLFMICFSLIGLLLDVIKLLFFPSWAISRFKSVSESIPSIPSFLAMYLKMLMGVVGLLWTLGKVGLSYYSFDWAHPFRQLFLYTIEGLVMWLLKDFVSLATFHKIMHRPAYYSLHKLHHSLTKDVTTLNGGFTFDSIDVIFEGFGGVALYPIVRYLVLGDSSFNVGAFIFSAWMDNSLHSSCVYTPTFLNPVLDLLFRPALKHSLLPPPGRARTSSSRRSVAWRQQAPAVPKKTFDEPRPGMWV